MGIQVALSHRTAYRYDKAVALGPQIIQLRPAPHCQTPVLDYALNITPADNTLKWQLDAHNNYLARVLFSSRTTEFSVEVNLIADLEAINPFDFFLEPEVEQFPFQYSAELAHDLGPYRTPEAAGPLLQELLSGASLERTGTVSFLVNLNHKVRDRIAYIVRLEPGVQTPEETLVKGSGSCRDSAWLLVQILRNLGFASRFVSGYLVQLASSDLADDSMPAGPPRHDSADLHAWAEVYLPGAGWIGLDATSGLFAAEGHIPLVCTPTASQAAPIGGTVEPSNVEFAYSMQVRRLNQGPAIAEENSSPYTEPDWARIRKVANAVDADLDSQQVRLTMGGEPTFIGLDEPESPQWNIDALGPIKQTRGLAMIRSLRNRLSTGAMLLYGQGKWYPGEPLPRWAYSCYWRSDGVAIWDNLELIAREDQSFQFGPDTALFFLRALSHRLQVSDTSILPAWNPAYDAPSQAEVPAGYLLPLRRRQHNGVLYWSSQLWFPRPDKLMLSPGDSPLGFRIPVEAIPWVAPDDLLYEKEAPSNPASSPRNHVKLPPARARRMDLFAQTPIDDPLPPLSTAGEDAKELIRPSLGVEARNGRLHIFLPYLSNLADYLDMVAAVEDTAQHLQKPIWLEGYTPPADPRLRSFSLTPDPGVLEVNLPPAASWDELETVNTLLFEEAHLHRLTTEKYGYDGVQLATGGGSHIVIGGATVEDSPILRRPDLLRSMVGFWQNHPSLSYLFSGLYVGPTSQYPRIDEARMDALYELEVSFRHLPTGPCEPSDIDGLFRNLLVDLTGNSHRAEFCIDKLYPPEGHGLRLGLLELRAFEMAPNARMGLVEMLLVRALVSSFWKQPFQGSLIPWGTALHDRFMLPHFVQQDFLEVLRHLQYAGLPFEPGWFSAHSEFRFSRTGTVSANGVTLELRRALEPWNVLAEESTSGGTVRSVDSSLERIQVKVQGFVPPSRYVVACNGRRVPLAPTETSGEFVAGIRFRARRLSATLHPTIPVHAPLVFDIIDTFKEHSIARCIYYIDSPDGRLYPARPVNAAEAAERRAARFTVSEPSADTMTAPPAETNPFFPLTLDLRWPAPASEPTPPR